MERWTVLKILKWTADYFGDKGIAAPRLDAELLLAEVLGLDRVGLYLNFDRPLVAEELDRFREFVRRRSQREPVQYILGATEFWSLELEVDARVLIPRADTEVLVEESLALGPADARVLDVGTGSGAVAVALSHERPDWQMTAIDVDPGVLAVAAANAERHGLAGRIAFREADLADLPGGPFDLVVGNPPYIPSAEWAELMPEVRDFEPRLALDGGSDGLDCYRLLADQAARLLAPGGWLLVEVGIGQADAVANLFAAAGLGDLRQRSDYADIPRVVGARRIDHDG